MRPVVYKSGVSSRIGSTTLISFSLVPCKYLPFLSHLLAAILTASSPSLLDLGAGVICFFSPDQRKLPDGGKFTIQGACRISIAFSFPERESGIFRESAMVGLT